MQKNETVAAKRHTKLDQFAPIYEFSEIHSIRVGTPAHWAYEAIKAVTTEEIFLFRTLVWLRRCGRSGRESVLNPPKHVAVLEIATRTTFLLLADEMDREIVVGMPVIVPPGSVGQKQWQAHQLATFEEPGFALATMNFLIDHEGPDFCRVSTETRIHATDATARRRFAWYWRIIYLGSGFIRRMWLRAIKRRAERAARGLKGGAQRLLP